MAQVDYRQERETAPWELVNTDEPLDPQEKSIAPPTEAGGGDYAAMVTVSTIERTFQVEVAGRQAMAAYDALPEDPNQARDEKYVKWVKELIWSYDTMDQAFDYTDFAKRL